MLGSYIPLAKFKQTSELSRNRIAASQCRVIRASADAVPPISFSDVI